MNAIKDAQALMEWARAHGFHRLQGGLVYAEISPALFHRKYCPTSTRSRVDNALARLSSLITNRSLENTERPGRRREIITIQIVDDEALAKLLIPESTRENSHGDADQKTEPNTETAKEVDSPDNVALKPAGPQYIQVPDSLMKRLNSHDCKKTFEEKEDILDAYILWYWGANNLLPEEENLLGGRKVSLTGALSTVARFRSSPIQRLYNAVELWERRKIGRSLDGETCLISEQVLPSFDWEKNSPSSAYFGQTELEAERRIIVRLFKLNDEKEFPLEPPAPMPTSLKASHDFIFLMNGIPIKFHKNDVLTDPIQIRFAIEHGYPVLGMDENNFAICATCGTKNEIPSIDDSETVSYLRATRDFACCFTHGQMINCYASGIIEAPLVEFLKDSGFPVMPLKRHDFICCKNCRKITHLKPLPT